MSMDTDCDCDCDPFLSSMEMKKRRRVAGCLRASAQDANNNGVETFEYSSNQQAFSPLSSIGIPQ